MARKEDPLFTGKAIWIRLPDQQDDKGKTYSLSTITFPDWVHRVYMDDNKLIDVRGSDLEQGMALDVKGCVAIIVDINKEQYYHGLMIPSIQIGEPAKSDVTNKKFRRNFYEDGRIEWTIESETKFKKKLENPQLDDPEIS